MPTSIRRFAPVRAVPERVIRHVAGLRPFRPTGFRVEEERVGDKTVVHNYGHGGAGVTLSWGTAKLAVEKAMRAGQGSASRYAVLGCGAVGLASARLLQLQGCLVTIYARDLPPNTTSNIAGAQWYPYGLWDTGSETSAFLLQFNDACRFAYARFASMIGDYYGIRWIENYCVGASLDEIEEGPVVLNGALADLFPERRQREHTNGFFGHRWSVQFTSMQIETPVYLNAVMRDFLIAGGKIVVREFGHAEELRSLTEPVIVNCTGLGAGRVFGDTEMYPKKGQLVLLLPQPEVDYNLLAGMTYMFPRKDAIVLGGTSEPHETNEKPDDAKAKEILANHAKLCGQPEELRG